MIALRVFIGFFLSLFLFGQASRIIPLSRSATGELQKVLELSDDQVNQLKQAQASRLSMAEAGYRNVTAKQKQLADLLVSGSTDALAIGNLSIEVQRLRSRTIAPTDEREQSIAVLTSPQKLKLAELQQVLILRQAADQAVAFHLIDYPRVAVVLQK